jgi:hypothetical protein
VIQLLGKNPTIYHLGTRGNGGGSTSNVTAYKDAGAVCVDPQQGTLEQKGDLVVSVPPLDKPGKHFVIYSCINR